MKWRRGPNFVDLDSLGYTDFHNLLVGVVTEMDFLADLMTTRLADEEDLKSISHLCTNVVYAWNERMLKLAGNQQFRVRWRPDSGIQTVSNAVFIPAGKNILAEQLFDQALLSVGKHPLYVTEENGKREIVGEKCCFDWHCVATEKDQLRVMPFRVVTQINPFAQ